MDCVVEIAIRSVFRFRRPILMALCCVPRVKGPRPGPHLSARQPTATHLDVLATGDEQHTLANPLLARSQGIGTSTTPRADGKPDAMSRLRVPDSR